jgi:hypothetical protein
MMNESNPTTTFRGLPLTPEQDSEIRHYIHVKLRCATPWDTPELQAMLADMLDPPELPDEDRQSLDASTALEQEAASDAQCPDDEAPPRHQH